MTIQDDVMTKQEAAGPLWIKPYNSNNRSHHLLFCVFFSESPFCILLSSLSSPFVTVIIVIFVVVTLQSADCNDLIRNHFEQVKMRLARFNVTPESSSALFFTL